MAVGRDIGWIDNFFFVFYCLPHPAWAAGRWAELAVELGRMIDIQDIHVNPTYATATCLNA